MAAAKPRRTQERRRATAREQEAAAAATPGPAGTTPAHEPRGEVAGMMARRGFRVTRTEPDLPFHGELAPERAARLAARMRHYAFRLFLRGAILQPGAFAPADATRYLTPAQAAECAEALVDLGLAARERESAYRLVRRPRSFGGLLEWYLAYELSQRYGFDVAAGVNFHAPGVGGDLDVLAAAEGKLFYVEAKSSPPKHLSQAEVGAFVDRVRTLRPHVALFAMDTALRLEDKVLPMLATELRARGGAAAEARRVDRGVWALSPHVYAVNARPDLVGNVGRAVAAGLLALAPAF